VNHLNKIRCDGGDGYMGTVNVGVFLPLLVGPNAVQNFVTGTVWAEFLRPDFEVISFRDLSTDVNDLAQMGGALSVLAKAGNVISVAGQSIDFAQKMSKQYQDGKGLDRPFDGMNPVPVLAYGGPDLSSLTNVDLGRYLGDSPGTSHLANRDDHGKREEEMKLGSWTRTSTFFEAVLYSTTNNVGDILDSIPMTPVPELHGAAYGSPIQLSTTAIATLPFEYWRGGFEVLVQVVSAIGQTGQVSIIPRYGTDGTGGVDEAFSAYATIIDISVPKTHKIVIPWRCTKKWLRVPHTIFSGTDEFNRYAMGMLQVTALTPLGASESVPGSCYLSFSFCMGEDFEVFLVSDGLSYAEIYNPYIGPYTKVDGLGPKAGEKRERRRLGGARRL